MTASTDPRLAQFLFMPDEQSVFADYLDLVAEAGLLRYKSLYQYGDKRGESLWTHIVTMISTLYALDPIIQLDDTEARVLYLAVTIHDINKMRDEKKSYSQLAQPATVAELLGEIGCDDFLPEWQNYLPDIVTIIRDHPGHYPVDGDALIVKHEETRLRRGRIEALQHLIRALDILALSHTLDERAHKNSFLGHFNAYLDTSGDSRQFTFMTHQVVEQRGLLSNVIHNVLIDVLSDAYTVLPLGIYPDGVIYLIERGEEVELNSEDATWLGERISQRIQTIIAGDVAKLIDPTKDGYKIKPDAFTAGVPFEILWLEVRNQLARRRFKPTDYDQNARPGAINEIRKRQQKQPEYGIELLEWLLNSPVPVVQATTEQFRSSELARAYYLFLKTYLSKSVKDPWRYIYSLLDLPEAQWDFYDLFNASSHRLYVLAGDITLTEDEVFDRLLVDAQQQLGEPSTSTESEQEPGLWAEYVQRYVLINGHPLSSDGWQDHLAHYMKNQHRQCVHCSSPFPTQLWMSADVRGGIKVQKFSYRLEGGGSGEPNKYVCEVCRTQFLLEKLNYPRGRGDRILYLHLFPYTFYAAPLVNGLRATFNRLRSSGVPLQALHLDVVSTAELLTGQITRPSFKTTTKAGMPHPYGVYIPSYSETTGGIIIFPINAPGENDTERFLFALWYALVLQRHFGVKVLMSRSPIPPLDFHTMPDLYLDHIPLGCSGLLPRNDYPIYEPPHDETGQLVKLWGVVEHLFILARFIFEEDTKIALVRAMASGPLHVFYTMDRLLQKHEGDKFLRAAFPHVHNLAIYSGGDWMTELSEYLQEIAVLAWQHKIKGRSWERSSILHPIAEVFGKLAKFGGPMDREALIAATVQDIFNHLERVADDQYKPGRTKYQAVEQFVRRWYDGVLDQAYNGNVQRLLADEKLLRSAYLFYWQAQSSK